jgi:serine protease Do
MEQLLKPMQRSMTINGTRVYAAAIVMAALALPAVAGRCAESSGMSLARQLNNAFIEVADKVSPSVVVIRVAQKNRIASLLQDDGERQWDWIPREFRKQLEEYLEKQKEQEEKEEPGSERRYDGQGSGVVIRKEGYILTNRHVVDGAEHIQVRFKDDSDWYDAELRGSDAQSDVAVIKIDPKGRELYAANLGDSDKVKVGEFAIAIGAPFNLDYSVTFGHISAKGRSHVILGESGASMDQDYLQTDASINPGNSGGPLVNIDGEMIGINTMIRGLQTGIGFAIPINLAREISDALITEGKYVRAWIGVAVQPVRDNPEFRQTQSTATNGLIVSRIPPEGPAAKSDLKPGDVILAVDGQPVSSAQQLRNAVRAKKVGHNFTLDVMRGAKNIKVKLKTEAWPDPQPSEVASKAPTQEDRETTKMFGLTVRALTSELAEQFGVEKVDGVVVVEVQQGSAAARKGLRVGDIITEVDHKTVTTAKEFRDAVKSADTKKGVMINFTSRGTGKYEILKESGD